VLGGEPVTAAVRVDGKQLVFQKAAGSPGADWQAEIELPPEAQRGEPCRVVLPFDHPAGLPVLVAFPKPVVVKEWELFSFQGWEPTSVFGWQGSYAMTLELGKREKGKVPGKVFLALGELDARDPAQRKNFLAGTFEAECPRQPTDPPGVEDVPFVNGSVTVRGAAPGAVLRVGYAAAPTPAAAPLGATEITLGSTDNPWSQAVYDRPRVTTLVAGNGKDVPSRYEHSKLTPGRYFVFAQLKDGPAAWKWVTVQAKSTIAVDMTIDAAQVGGVEVTTPLGTLGKVLVVPAEDEGQPAISPEFFTGIALNMPLERDIILRKALFTNLAPGRYEIRAGNDSRFVEIVAGKTLELDFDKPQPPPKK
jgi:hypothetical protein